MVFYYFLVPTKEPMLLSFYKNQTLQVVFLDVKLALGFVAFLRRKKVEGLLD